jgi:FMN phosphatase YigB (HAD superfamily)
MIKCLLSIHSPMKAVLFDLGHTLIDYYCDWKGPEERGVKRVYDLISCSSDEPIDQMEFTAYLSSLLVNARDRKRQGMVEIPLEESVARCLQRFGIEDDSILLDALEIFYGVLLEDRKMVSGAPELLFRVKERGLSIGLVSDVAWGLPSEFSLRDIRHYGLDLYFDDMVFSTDVGLRKPHPKIFKIALSNLRVEAAESIFVGNSIQQDIKGAKGVGMRTVLKRSSYCPMEEGVVPDYVVSTLEEIDAILDEN